MGNKEEMEELGAIQETLRERPDLLTLYNLCKEGIDAQMLMQIEEALEEEGVNPEFIEAIRKFEKKK